MEFMQQMNCLDMMSNPDRQCMSCKKGQYLSNTELTCKFCNKIGCEACSDSSCQRCGEGLFDNQLSGLCQPCFYGCRSCTSSKYDSCDSCLDGFYWRPTEYNTHGQCSPCHPSCKTCTGPSENQCSEFARGKFAIDFGSPLNQTLDCDSSCGHCEESATKCSSCYISDSFSFDQILYDKSLSTCTLTSEPAITDCFQVDRVSSGALECPVCGFLKFWDENRQACVESLRLTYCLLGTANPRSGDQECLICQAFQGENSFGLNRETKTCELITPAKHGEGWGYCTNPEMRSFYPYCPNCQDVDSGFRIDTETGRCTDVAQPHQIPGIFNGIQIWLEPSPGCVEAIFDSANEFNFHCTLCNTPAFGKVNPSDHHCLNQQCNSPHRGINKHCRASDPDCDSRLCISTTPEFLTAGKYSFFELAFSGTQIEIRFKKEWDFFFKVEVKAFAVYDEISATQKRVFCRLLSENLNDDQSICTWVSNNDYTKLILDVTPEMYRKLTASTSTPFLTLKKSALAIKRKWITDVGVLGVDLTDAAVFSPPLDFELALKFNDKGHKDSNWLPVYQPFAVFNQKLSLKVAEKDSRLNIMSYDWRCLKVLGEATPALRDSFNSTLQTFKNAAVDLDLTNAQLQGKSLVMLLTIKDEFYQEYYHLFDLQVVAIPRALEPASSDPIFYTDGTESTYIALFPLVEQFDPSQVSVSSVGLTGTMTSQIITRSNHIVLALKVQNGNDFNITLSYQTYTPTVLTMIKVRKHVQSLIIHEKSVDVESPLIVQVINRATSFRVFCVEESTSSSCLNDPTLTSYSPGERVTLSSPFNFLSSPQAEKTLFFVTTIGSDVSISSSKIVQREGSQVGIKIQEVTSRAGIMYPESPFFLSDDNFYLDFKNLKISNPTSYPTNYLDNNLIVQQGNVAFSSDSESPFLLTQSQNLLAHKIVSSVGFTTENQATHTLTQSRIISKPVSSTVQLSQKSVNNNLINLRLTVSSAQRGTCNQPLGQFPTQFIFDDKVIVSDLGSTALLQFIPGVFSSLPVTVSAKTHTNCGPVSSQPTTFTGISGLSPSLSSYLTVLLSSIDSKTTPERINILNIGMLNIWKAYHACLTQSVCIAPLADLKIAAESILSHEPSSYDQDNKFSISGRFSFIGSFLWESTLVNDATLRELSASLASTTHHLKTTVEPLLSSHQRLSRNLRLALSGLDLIQADLVDLPIRTASQVLAAQLFSYSDDSDRSALLQSTVTDLITLSELKQVRVSSHQKTETYEDQNLKMLGKTFLTPLEPEISIETSSTSKLVFKNLAFTTTSAYLDLIIINWKTSTLNKLRSLPVASSLGLREYYIEFRSQFSKINTLSGEVQVLDVSCAQEVKCSSSVLENYNVCACFKLNEQQEPNPIPPSDPVDPPSDPVDPPSDPVDPPSDPVDPPSDPVDPPSDPVDPPSDPVDPPSDPVDPPSDPVDPPSDPVDPPSDPVDPPSDPVDPPSDPVDPPSDPVDPPSDPVDPPSDPVDPPSDPVDPPSDPVDPPSDPVDPPSDPVDPPSDPVDPPSDPVDPPSDPVDPPSDPVDPPSDPVDPPSDPVDPPSDPVDPPSDPVDPPSDPVDPPSDPVDPPSDPVDPPSDPVDPPSDPVDPPSDPVDPPSDPVDPPSNPPTDPKPDCDKDHHSKDKKKCDRADHDHSKDQGNHYGHNNHEDCDRDQGKGSNHDDDEKQDKDNKECDRNHDKDSDDCSGNKDQHKDRDGKDDKDRDHERENSNDNCKDGSKDTKEKDKKKDSKDKKEENKSETDKKDDKKDDKKKQEEEKKRIEDEKKRIEEENKKKEDEKKRIEEEKKRIEDEKKRIEEENKKKEEEKKRIEDEKKRIEEEKKKKEDEKKRIEEENKKKEDEKKRIEEENKKKEDEKKKQDSKSKDSSKNTKKSSIVAVASSKEITMNTSHSTDDSTLVKDSSNGNFNLLKYSLLVIILAYTLFYLVSLLLTPILNRRTAKFTNDASIQFSTYRQTGNQKQNITSLYLLLLKMNHPILSIFYLHSKNQRTFIKLSLPYLRLLMHFCISIYITIGMDYSSSVLACMTQAVAISGSVLILFFFLNTLVNTSGVKISSSNSSRADTTAQVPSSTETERVAISNVNIFSEGSYSKRRPACVTAPANTAVEISQPQTSTSTRALAVSFLAVTLALVIAVFAFDSTDKSRTQTFKPFAYVMMLAFDLIVFLPLVAVAQLFVLKARLANPTLLNEKIARLAFNRDFLAMIEEIPLK
jgi:hypothetical protein